MIYLIVGGMRLRPLADGHWSRLARLLQRFAVNRGRSFIQPILGSLASHFVESTASLDALAFAICEYVVEAKTPVTLVTKTFIRQLMLVEVTDERVPADVKQVGRFLCRQLFVNRFG